MTSPPGGAPPHAARADAALLALAAIWGLTFPLIRTALSDVDAWRFLAARFALAAVVFLPLVLVRPEVRRHLLTGWGWAVALGFVAWVGYLTQTLGLRTVASGRAAFLTGTNVILVPLVAPLFRAGRPGARETASALLAVGGLWLMTAPEGGGLTGGDGLVLVCAGSYAVYIHTLQKALRRTPSPTALAFQQVVVIAALSLATLPLAGPQADFTSPVWRAVLFTALAATVGSFWIHTTFQGRTTPARTALMFSMEPVFAAVFGVLLLSEVPSLREAAGGAVVLAAVLLVELRPLGRARRRRQETLSQTPPPG